MGVRIDRVKDELLDFWAEVENNIHEIFVENRPRYRNVKEWHHLALDVLVSVLSILKAAVMPYTLAHVVAAAIPVSVILAL